MGFDRQQNLSHALDHARRSPTFVASLFVPWEKAFGGTVADGLSAGPDKVVSLGLCQRPREDRWAGDVEEIARVCGVDARKLAALLRQAMVAERLASAPPISDVMDGRLLAARDREGDPEQ